MANTMIFETATPENVGIPSGAVSAFLERIRNKGLCLHGFLLLRHGKLIAEGYAQPFTKDRLHRMYSISKTFVSAAIGIMSGEGRIRLDDKVCGYFPEKLPEQPDQRLLDTTIRDLLIMSTPFNTTTYGNKDSDWVATFFAAKATHAPGTIFSYNTAATVVLNAIVEKVSGQELLAYLRPRLLEHIGFSPEAYCIERPEGGAWGGSGVLCAPRDLAAFALVFMNGGRWEGKQLIPADYVKAAISKQTDNRTVESGTETKFGYGYQIWKTRHNGFSMTGMGGQYALCFPEKDTILVTTADTQLVLNGAGEILDAFFDNIHGNISDNALPENPDAADKLAEDCAGIRFPALSGINEPEIAAKISGSEYLFEENPMKISRMRFELNEDTVRINYTNATGEHEIAAGIGTYVKGVFPETHYYGRKIGVPAGRGYECVSSAVWADPRTLVCVVCITDDYLGTLKIQFVFGDNDVSVLMQKAAEWFLDEYQGFAYGKK